MKYRSKIALTSFVVCILGLISGSLVCARTTSQSNVVELNRTMSTLIAQQTFDFAKHLTTQIRDEAPDSKSTVFSPLSIMSALALLMLGARGTASDELYGLFQLKKNPTDFRNFHTQFSSLLEDLQSSVELPPEKKHLNSIMKVANGIFPGTGQKLNQNYVSVAKSLYNVTFQRLSFESRPEPARRFINSWVERNTMGKIREVLSKAPSSETDMIIANTVYFKGSWEHKFGLVPKGGLKFYPNGKNNPFVRKPAMYVSDMFPFYKSLEYNCKIIGLPYADGVTTMYVILPDDSTPTKLRNLHGALSAQKVKELISKMRIREVYVALPKMSLTTNLNLKSLLPRLGVNEIFNPGSSDLSVISSPQFRGHNVFIDELIHQVKIDVTEAGTEAAGVTRSITERSGSLQGFVANGPFMFLIQHDPTQLPIFYGIVNEP